MEAKELGPRLSSLRPIQFLAGFPELEACLSSTWAELWQLSKVARPPASKQTRRLSPWPALIPPKQRPGLHSPHFQSRPLSCRQPPKAAPSSLTIAPEVQPLSAAGPLERALLCWPLTLGQAAGFPRMLPLLPGVATDRRKVSCELAHCNVFLLKTYLPYALWGKTLYMLCGWVHLAKKMACGISP